MLRPEETINVRWAMWIDVFKFLFLLPVQTSGLLCQSDPETSQAAVWPQLSTDTVLRCSSVRRRGATRVREGRWWQHRRRLHHVWSVCICTNSANQKSQYRRHWRGLCQPSLKEAFNWSRHAISALFATWSTATRWHCLSWYQKW